MPLETRLPDAFGAQRAAKLLSLAGLSRGGGRRRRELQVHVAQH